nr:hypothetical protein Iba_chr02eCG7110 [Ipomoea batatas]
MNERPKEGLGFPRIAAQKPGEVGIAGHLLALLQRGDILTDHVLRRLGTAKEIVRHMRELRRQERAQTFAPTRRIPDGLSGRDHSTNPIYEARRVLPALSQRIENGSRPASCQTLLPLQWRDLLDLLVCRLLLPSPSRGTGDLEVLCGSGSGRTRWYGRRCPLCSCGLDRERRSAPSQSHLWARLLGTSRGRRETPLKNHPCTIQNKSKQ